MFLDGGFIRDYKHCVCIDWFSECAVMGDWFLEYGVISYPTMCSYTRHGEYQLPKIIHWVLLIVVALLKGYGQSAGDPNY